MSWKRKLVQKNRWAVGLAALALTSLAACGGGDTEEGSGSTESDNPSATPAEELEVLTAEEAELALIPESAMGETFMATEPTDEESDTDLGCLSALDEMDDLGAETKAEVEYVPTDESGFPALENSVFSYDETEVITTRMQDISTALDGCDSVDVTDEEGTNFTLDVDFESGVTTEGADEQVTLVASGKITTPDQEVPISFYMSSVRVENHVTVVIYSELSDDVEAGSAQFDSYVTAATDRLVSVAAGETPAEESLS